MTGFQAPTHSTAWLRRLAEAGYPDAEPLATGTEGAVYRLGSETVAKVWAPGRELEELRRLQDFYADVARAVLPFATPEILAVRELDGSPVTIERELHGTPLREQPDDPGREPEPAAVDATLTVLRGLATVPATIAVRRLAVRGEDRPLWAGHAGFADALAALVRRRIARNRAVLRPHVRRFDRKTARVLELLAEQSERPGVRLVAVHGDLVPPNILVDAEQRPTAVLDFGFLTTAGDPAFEAGITAAIHNMYGPHAPAHTDLLTERFAKELGYPAELLRLHQAAYALVTSNLFTTDGSDGHFRWCTELLNNPAVLSALDL
jgi:aminoglycoside phosphotransferase (APT) family kinase protein